MSQDSLEQMDSLEDNELLSFGDPLMIPSTLITSATGESQWPDHPLPKDNTPVIFLLTTHIGCPLHEDFRDEVELDPHSGMMTSKTQPTLSVTYHSALGFSLPGSFGNSLLSLFQIHQGGSGFFNIALNTTAQKEHHQAWLNVLDSEEEYSVNWRHVGNTILLQTYISSDRIPTDSEAHLFLNDVLEQAQVWFRPGWGEASFFLPMVKVTPNETPHPLASSYVTLNQTMTRSQDYSTPEAIQWVADEMNARYEAKILRQTVNPQFRPENVTTPETLNLNGATLSECSDHSCLNPSTAVNPASTQEASDIIKSSKKRSL